MLYILYKMKWLEALKEWNAKMNKGVWKIPKKGTK